MSEQARQATPPDDEMREYWQRLPGEAARACAEWDFIDANTGKYLGVI
jgi:hypothetical protein